MVGYLIRRTGQAIIVLLIVTVVALAMASAVGWMPLSPRALSGGRLWPGRRGP
jgi:hypothetical protein